MKVTASKLRENIYRLLDEVLDTGEPLMIERKGRILKIEPADRGPRDDRLSRFVRRDDIIGDPEDLVDIDWSTYWNPDPS